MKTISSIMRGLIVVLAVAGFAFAGCGGGGGSSTTPADVPIDAGGGGGDDGGVIALDSKTATTALAGVLNASVMNAFGIAEAAASVSKAMPPEIAALCTEAFAFSYACPGGGAIVGAGPCEAVELGSCAFLLNLAVEYQDCVGEEGFALSGSSEMALRMAFFGCAVEEGVASMWRARFAAGLPVADGAGGVVTLDEVLFTSMLDGSVEMYSTSHVGGELYGCATTDGEIVCTPGDPEQVTDLCDGDPACVVDTDCPAEDGEGVPYFCDRGCCIAYGAPEKFVCTGMRECSNNFDCYRPDIHLYCEDGICQQPCLDDGVCRNGAVCNNWPLVAPPSLMFQELFGVNTYDGYYTCVCIDDPPPPPPPPGP